MKVEIYVSCSRITISSKPHCPSIPHSQKLASSAFSSKFKVIELPVSAVTGFSPLLPLIAFDVFLWSDIRISLHRPCGPEL